MANQNKAKIYNIRDFIQLKKIRIPEYQRPYKWGDKSVLQLLEDIYTFRNKPKYRFGTIVIHEHELTEEGNIQEYYDIVDGQQRYTTLRLLIKALCKHVLDNLKYQPNTQSELKKLQEELDGIKISYSNKKSIENIHKNYLLIRRNLHNFDDRTIYNFIHNFEVVVFFIQDETEAFQFFDSQNSRGKDLYPHDLLKAFHLREFDKTELEAQDQIVEYWEKYQSKALSRLFSNYLFRIKRWSNNKHARYFGKEHIALFKGVSIGEIGSYPYVKPLQIVHHFVDQYNASYERKIDQSKMEFPFQIDGIIINGRRFFEYVNYYMGINERFKETYLVDRDNEEDYTRLEKLVRLIYKNVFAGRTGESYIKDLFDCVIIYYMDKFGEEELDAFIEKAFVWCFYLRFEYQRLGFDSLDNYVVKHNLFRIIKVAISPKEVMRASFHQLPAISEVDQFIERSSRRMDHKIVQFFKDNHYYVS